MGRDRRAGVARFPWCPVGPLRCCVPPHPPGQIIQTLDTDKAGDIEETHTGEWQPGPKSLQLLDRLVPERKSGQLGPGLRSPGHREEIGGSPGHSSVGHQLEPSCPLAP